MEVCCSLGVLSFLLLQVKIPKTIGGEEKKLMEQLRELQASKPAASAGRGWF